MNHESTNILHSRRIKWSGRKKRVEVMETMWISANSIFGCILICIFGVQTKSEHGIDLDQVRHLVAVFVQKVNMSLITASSLSCESGSFVYIVTNVTHSTSQNEFENEANGTIIKSTPFRLITFLSWCRIDIVDDEKAPHFLQLFSRSFVWREI